MPAAIEKALVREALRKGYATVKEGKTVLTKRGRAFVYGTLKKKFGWRPSS